MFRPFKNVMFWKRPGKVITYLLSFLVRKFESFHPITMRAKRLAFSIKGSAVVLTFPITIVLVYGQ